MSRTWSVNGTVVASTYVGEVVADTAAEALKKAQALCPHVSVCHQCSDGISDPEVQAISVCAHDNDDLLSDDEGDAENATLRAQVANLVSTLDAVEKQRDALRAKVSELTEHSAWLTDQCGRYEEKNIDLTEQLKTAVKNVVAYNAVAERMDAENQRYCEQVAIEKRHWANSNKVIEKLEAQVAALTHRVGSLETERDHLHDELQAEANRENAALTADKESLRLSYLDACKTIAEMHGAAVGGYGLAPKRGVVEDVHDLRADVERLTKERDTHKDNEDACLRQWRAEIDAMHADNARHLAAIETLRAACDRAQDAIDSQFKRDDAAIACRHALAATADYAKKADDADKENA